MPKATEARCKQLGQARPTQCSGSGILRLSKAVDSVACVGGLVWSERGACEFAQADERNPSRDISVVARADGRLSSQARESAGSWSIVLPRVPHVDRCRICR